MTRLEEIERTYCLKWRARFDLSRKKVLSTLFSEFSEISFKGVGSGLAEANQNCVEVFDIHQELWRKGLLTTKNLN